MRDRVLTALGWAVLLVGLGWGASHWNRVGAAEAGRAREIRVLIVTGVDHPAHDWKTTTPAVREVLALDARMKVDVLEDPYRLGAADLARYDVVLLHFMNWEKPDPDEAARHNLRRHVQEGGGLFLLHFACGAFPKWDEYERLAGRIWDRTNSHDPRGPFTVKIVKPDHPVTSGLRDFETDDELYICLTGSTPVELLATARSKVTRTDHPMALVHAYGKGRVFQTPLGHDARAIRTPGAAEFIRRGVAWAAAGR